MLSLFSPFTLVIVSIAIYIFKNYVAVPAGLSSIPRFNIWQTILLNLALLGKSVPERSKLVKEFKQKIKANDIIINWALGTWIVAVDSPELAKELLRNTGLFYKARIGGKGDSISTRLMGDNIVSLNGEEWREMRKIVNPPFHRGWETNQMGECVDLLLNILGKSESVLVTDLMQRLTLDIFGKIIFNYDFNTLSGDDNSEAVQAYYGCGKILSSVAPFFFPWIIKFPLLVQGHLDSIARLDKFLYGIIRKKTSSDPPDLLDLIIQSNAKENSLLSDKQIRDNVFIFFLAGHETTSNALSFALYWLAKFPQEQIKVQNEIDSVIDGGSVPCIDDLNEFHHLSAVIKETMRMCPSVGVLPLRRAVRDGALGKHQIPSGTFVSLEIYNIHRNHNYWPDPDAFKPSRFLNDQDKLAHSIEYNYDYSWIPFGGGSRVCIGQSFSLIEQRVVLAMILSKFNVGFPDGVSRELSFENGILLKAKDLRLTFTPR